MLGLHVRVIRKELLVEEGLDLCPEGRKELKWMDIGEEVVL